MTPSTSAPPPPGGLSDSATDGSSSRSVSRTVSRLLGLPADGLAQEPDAVPDVAGLVVVDQGVALDEPREQVLARR